MKRKQRKKLLHRALKSAGICQCIILRKLVGNVRDGLGVMSAPCSACGQTLKIHSKQTRGEGMTKFLECVSPTDDFCRHFCYWETLGKRVAYNFQGKQINAVLPCYCGKPPIVLEGYAFRENQAA